MIPLFVGVASLVLPCSAFTGAAWQVSFDYRDGTYWHEPQGNLRNIRRPYASRTIEPNLVPAGTH
ncbi:hypothetical protein ED923_10835 [Salmonella enterica]|nr:hypothetical protein [Salmonella enterica]